MHEFGLSFFLYMHMLFLTSQEKLARVRMLQAELMSEPTRNLSAASPESAAPAPGEMPSIYVSIFFGLWS